MRRGGALELALSRAGRDYRREGKCCLLRQHPPIANGPGGAFYSGQAPIDFIGAHSTGQLIAIEAKEVRTPSLPLSRLRDDQRQLLEIFHSLGADVRLVIDFTGLEEVYGIAWTVLAAFIEAPTRASLSLDWCRANGLLLSEEHAEDQTRRRVLFLDGAEHPDAARARDAIAASEQHRTDRAEPEPPLTTDTVSAIDDTVSPKAPARAQRPRLSLGEAHARVIDACREGIERQQRKPQRKFTYGRRRA